MTKKTLFYIIILFSVCSASASLASTVKIKCTESEYKSTKLTFYRYADLISMREIKLTECQTDTSGKFECIVDIPSTCQVFTYLGSCKGIFFAEPGRNYDLVLPPRKEKTLAEDLNPFYTPEELSIGIKNSNEKELNYLITSFNTIYEPFLTDNFDYLYVYSDIKKVDSIQKVLFEKFSYSKNQYFIDYMKYRCYFLRYFTFDRDKNYATMKYFTKYPILYQNPAYMEFFTQMWGKYFSYLGLDKFGEKLMSDVVYAKSPTEIKKTLNLNISLRNDSLRELVMLKGLLDCYSKPEMYPVESINQTLDSVILLSSIAEHKDIARNILSREIKLKQGDTVPDFSLFNARGEKVSLSDFRGKFVYLVFGRSENYACQKEYRLLQDINNSKINGLQILTISTDQDQATFDDFVKSNPAYSWEFVFDPDKKITNQFAIRIQPSFILIDPEGRIAMIPAVSPHENFKMYFSQIQKWRQRALDAKNRNRQR